MSRLAAAALIVLALAALPLWQPHPADAIDLDRALLGPGTLHWLGTDHLGRDLLSRVLAGASGTATVLAVVASATVAVGGAVGLAAALAGGAAERLLLRLADLSLVLPQLVVALALTAVLGLSPVSAGLALALGGWGPYAVAAHGLALRVLAEPYVLAARAAGAGPTRVALAHVAPNAAPTFLVLVGADLGRTVLNYAALAFLGLGADTGGHDWGALLFEYRVHGLDHPHLMIAPGAAIAVVAGALNLLLDPRALGEAGSPGR